MKNQYKPLELCKLSTVGRCVVAVWSLCGRCVVAVWSPCGRCVVAVTLVYLC